LWLFLALTSSVEAASVAGESASLAFSTRANKAEIEAIRDFKKKLAIEAVLERYDSPMVEATDSFLATCKKYSLNCYLLPSIAGLESTFGRFIYPNSYNPFGWGRGYIMFNEWSESIDAVGAGLRNNYINAGAQSVEEIGSIYSESDTWAIRIRWFMNEFEKEEKKLSLYDEDFPVQL
jgi:hypothetical protein